MVAVDPWVGAALGPRSCNSVADYDRIVPLGFRPSGGEALGVAQR